MNYRRNLLIALGAGALAAQLSSFAQAARTQAPRIGLLEGSSNSSRASEWDALIAALAELGYVDGKNIIIEYRGAQGKYERLNGLAAELVQMKVDVIVAAGTNAIQAAQRATATIPIIMVRTGDPVGLGFVASLSRPGRNITGLSSINIDVISKYLEFLRIVVPGLSRVTVLMNPGNPTNVTYLKRIQATQKANSVQISPAQASIASQIDIAFGLMKKEGTGALIVLPDAFFFEQAARIAGTALQLRLPTMFWTRAPLEFGGLMSYGQNIAEHYYRSATYVDKILKGAKPADLPVEQATKIELVINLKTAKALGLTIPQPLLLRADELIQ